jgi:hypothetical protein
MMIRLPFLRTCVLSLALAAAHTTVFAQTEPALPPGHPPMGAEAGPAGTAKLPKGHPSIEDMMAAAAQTQDQPASTAPAVKGTISIHLVPGTAGGSSLANEPITVELYHRGAVLQKWEVKTNAAGAATITDVPAQVPAHALVTVNHKGLLQQAVGEVLEPANPQQTIEMRVYEGTDARPAWTVAMRHVIVRWTPSTPGLEVTEMLSATNPSDRAWLGDKHASGEKIDRTTLILPLPANASDVQLHAGFDDGGTAVQNNAIVSSSPLFPGPTQFRLSYTVPAPGGVASLTITAPNAPVGHMMVFVPADATTVKATGLQGGQPMSMGAGGGMAAPGATGEAQQVRAFSAADLAPGQTATLAFTGIVPGPEPTPDGADAAPDAPVKKDKTAQTVAIGGALLIAVAGTGFFFMKKPKVAPVPAGRRKGQT